MFGFPIQNVTIKVTIKKKYILPFLIMSIICMCVCVCVCVC